ncbi:MAG: NtaA/DmoA family FMN-dependent monooxygenase [Burkholderiaceae bacterium]|jgi:FMN-dependent oxidoreductase (nitrilotriacetate monooxygenase family)|nr:NtaA/DmoA family FMN-dependent monooxygenase [Burkholderiaceae bacterium]
MSAKKPVRLGVNVLASGRHDAAWKTLPNAADLSTDIDEFVRIAQLAERGRIDALFLAENPAGRFSDAYYRPWRALDPLALHAALSQATRHIGLVVTTTTLYGHPYITARQIASLEHISKGRAGWNITTSQDPETLQAYGLKEGFEQKQRYERATEFTQIVTSLWDSLPREAVVADARRNVFVDPARLRPINVQGQHFRSAGALLTPVGPQGRPVIFQAGESEESKAFGARWADALFTGQRTLQNAQKFYADVKALAQGYGRDPDRLLVVPGLFPILGGTEAEAQRRKDELDELLDHEALRIELARQLAIDPEDLPLDAPPPYDKIEAAKNNQPQSLRWHRTQILNEARQNNWTVRQVVRGNFRGGHRVIVGTPEQVAADILYWVDHGAADGFNFNIDILTSGLKDLVEQLIPELQKAGRFRREYEGTTLRDNLGLPRYQAAAA